MKNFGKLIFQSVFVFLVLAVTTGCRDMLHDINEIAVDLTPVASASLVQIQDINNGGETRIAHPYSINIYETTYFLWHEVFEWGKSNGFIFIKSAEAGDTEFTGEPGLYAYFPVTTCHPADIFVWCNAYSVKNGLTPVYYTDSELKKMLTNSKKIAKAEYLSDDTIHHDANGNLVKYKFEIEETFYQKIDANGYRLPSVAEWQYAAMGAKRTDQDRKYKYSGSNNIEEVTSTSNMLLVGSLKPNGIGAYDMSGNVAEYCIAGTADNEQNFIAINHNSLRCYGGHYLKPNNQILSVQNPYDLHNIISHYPYLFGFRLARNGC